MLDMIMSELDGKGQSFDSRYIDRSRLETLLITLHGDKSFEAHRRLDKWVVKAPSRLNKVRSPLPRSLSALIVPGTNRGPPTMSMLLLRRCGQSEPSAFRVFGETAYARGSVIRMTIDKKTT